MAEEIPDRELENDACIGCSRTNPESLQLTFTRTGEDSVESQFTLREELCGWPGVAHGGIVSLLIDEVTSWCFSICLEESRFATREMTVRFLRPTPVTQPLVAEGRVVADHGRVVDLVGEVRYPDGRVTARGKVQIVRLAPEDYDRFKRGG